MIKFLNFNKEKRKIDMPMLFIIFLLLCVGLVALASASSYSALSTYSDSNYYLKRQLVFAVIGVIAMLGISKMEYSNYEKYGYIIYVFALLLMAAVFIPKIGVTVKGATRWIGLRAFAISAVRSYESGFSNRSINISI